MKDLIRGGCGTCVHVGSHPDKLPFTHCPHATTCGFHVNDRGQRDYPNWEQETSVQKPVNHEDPRDMSDPELGKIVFSELGLSATMDASFGDALADQIVTTGYGMLSVIKNMQERGCTCSMDLNPVGTWRAYFCNRLATRLESCEGAELPKCVSIAALLMIRGEKK